jgi:hypothetical protein
MCTDRYLTVCFCEIFLQERAYAQESPAIVWGGIAMHASRIGQFKQAEIALSAEGVGADALGAALSVRVLAMQCLLQNILDFILR